MHGWKTCCYAEAVECRKSAALFRFAVYIPELVSCIMSALDFLTLKLLVGLLALPFVFQLNASFTSRRRPFPFSLIKNCRRVSRRIYTFALWMCIEDDSSSVKVNDASWSIYTFQWFNSFH